MLNTLKNLKKDREFAVKDGEQNQYGLVGRSLLVILGMKDGLRDSVRFGDATPVGNNVFAGKGDTIVYTLAANSKNSLDKDLFAWRDKSVAKVKMDDVREFRLRNSHGEFSLSREGTNWLITSPINERADNSTANSIIRKFESGKVKSIVSESFDNPAQFNLNQPAYVADLYLGEARAHKRIIFSEIRNNSANGKDDGRPYVFTVDSVFIRDLNKSLFDLRLKTIVEFDQPSIDSITVWQGDSLLTFSKDTSNIWIYGTDQKVKQWKVNSLLSSLKNLKAEKFLMEKVSNPRKYGLDNPDVIVKLFRTGEMVQEVHLARPREDQHVAYSVESGKVIEIGMTSFNNIEVKLPDYLDTENKDS